MTTYKRYPYRLTSEAEKLIRDRDISISRFAARINVDPTSLYRSLDGKHNVTEKRAESIAKMLGVPVESIVDKPLNMRKQYHKTKHKKYLIGR